MRDIVKLGRVKGSCCPGHDKFPNGSYRNRRSKKARAKGIKAEHRLVRRVLKQQLTASAHTPEAQEGGAPDAATGETR